MSELPSERATEIVRQRGEQYGSPLPIAITTCEFWNTWLRIDGVTDPDGLLRIIDPIKDYGIMLGLHKVARQLHSPDHPDHIDDVCGYMNVHHMIAKEI